MPAVFRLHQPISANVKRAIMDLGLLVFLQSAQQEPSNSRSLVSVMNVSTVNHDSLVETRTQALHQLRVNAKKAGVEMENSVYR